MFLVAANTRQAIVGQKEWLTTGSSGIQVQFLFSDDWDGLVLSAADVKMLEPFIEFYEEGET